MASLHRYYSGQHIQLLKKYEPQVLYIDEGAAEILQSTQTVGELIKLGVACVADISEAGTAAPLLWPLQSEDGLRVAVLLTSYLSDCLADLQAIVEAHPTARLTILCAFDENAHAMSTCSGLEADPYNQVIDLLQRSSRPAPATSPLASPGSPLAGLLPREGWRRPRQQISIRHWPLDIVPLGGSAFVLPRAGAARRYARLGPLPAGLIPPPRPPDSSHHEALTSPLGVLAYSLLNLAATLHVKFDVFAAGPVAQHLQRELAAGAFSLVDLAVQQGGALLLVDRGLDLLGPAQAARSLGSQLVEFLADKERAEHVAGRRGCMPEQRRPAGAQPASADAASRSPACEYTPVSAKGKSIELEGVRRLLASIQSKLVYDQYGKQRQTPWAVTQLEGNQGTFDVPGQGAAGYQPAQRQPRSDGLQTSGAGDILGVIAEVAAAREGAMDGGAPGAGPADTFALKDRPVYNGVRWQLPLLLPAGPGGEPAVPSVLTLPEGSGQPGRALAAAAVACTPSQGGVKLEASLPSVEEHDVLDAVASTGHQRGAVSPEASNVAALAAALRLRAASPSSVTHQTRCVEAEEQLRACAHQPSADLLTRLLAILGQQQETMDGLKARAGGIEPRRWSFSSGSGAVLQGGRQDCSVPLLADVVQEAVGIRTQSVACCVCAAGLLAEQQHYGRDPFPPDQRAAIHAVLVELLSSYQQTLSLVQDQALKLKEELENGPSAGGPMDGAKRGPIAVCEASARGPSSQRASLEARQSTTWRYPEGHSGTVTYTRRTRGSGCGPREAWPCSLDESTRQAQGHTQGSGRAAQHIADQGCEQRADRLACERLPTQATQRSTAAPHAQQGASGGAGQAQGQGPAPRLPGLKARGCGAGSGSSAAAEVQRASVQLRACRDGQWAARQRREGPQAQRLNSSRTGQQGADCRIETASYAWPSTGLHCQRPASEASGTARCRPAPGHSDPSQACSCNESSCSSRDSRWTKTGCSCCSEGCASARSSHNALAVGRCTCQAPSPQQWPGLGRWPAGPVAEAQAGGSAGSSDAGWEVDLDLEDVLPPPEVPSCSATSLPRSPSVSENGPAPGQALGVHGSGSGPQGSCSPSAPQVAVEQADGRSGLDALDASAVAAGGDHAPGGPRQCVTGPANLAEPIDATLGDDRRLTEASQNEAEEEGDLEEAGWQLDDIDITGLPGGRAASPEADCPAPDWSGAAAAAASAVGTLDIPASSVAWTRGDADREGWNIDLEADLWGQCQATQPPMGAQQQAVPPSGEGIVESPGGQPYGSPQPVHGCDEAAGPEGLSLIEGPSGTGRRFSPESALQLGQCADARVAPGGWEPPSAGGHPELQLMAATSGDQESSVGPPGTGNTAAGQEAGATSSGDEVAALACRVVDEALEGPQPWASVAEGAGQQDGCAQAGHQDAVGGGMSDVHKAGSPSDELISAACWRGTLAAGADHEVVAQRSKQGAGSPQLSTPQQVTERSPEWDLGQQQQAGEGCDLLQGVTDSAAPAAAGSDLEAAHAAAGGQHGPHIEGLPRGASPRSSDGGGAGQASDAREQLIGRGDLEADRPDAAGVAASWAAQAMAGAGQRQGHPKVGQGERTCQTVAVAAARGAVADQADAGGQQAQDPANRLDYTPAGLGGVAAGRPGAEQAPVAAAGNCAVSSQASQGSFLQEGHPEQAASSQYQPGGHDAAGGSKANQPAAGPGAEAAAFPSPPRPAEAGKPGAAASTSCSCIEVMRPAVEPTTAAVAQQAPPAHDQTPQVESTLGIQVEPLSQSLELGARLAGEPNAGWDFNVADILEDLGQEGNDTSFALTQGDEQCQSRSMEAAQQRPAASSASAEGGPLVPDLAQEQGRGVQAAADLVGPRVQGLGAASAAPTAAHQLGQHPPTLQAGLREQSGDGNSQETAAIEQEEYANGSLKRENRAVYGRAVQDTLQSPTVDYADVAHVQAALAGEVSDLIGKSVSRHQATKESHPSELTTEQKAEAAQGQTQEGRSAPQAGGAARPGSRAAVTSRQRAKVGRPRLGAQRVSGGLRQGAGGGAGGASTRSPRPAAPTAALTARDCHTLAPHTSSSRGQNISQNLQSPRLDSEQGWDGFDDFQLPEGSGATGIVSSGDAAAALSRSPKQADKGQDIGYSAAVEAARTAGTDGVQNYPADLQAEWDAWEDDFKATGIDPADSKLAKIMRGRKVSPGGTAAEHEEARTGQEQPQPPPPSALHATQASQDPRTAISADVDRLLHMLASVASAREQLPAVRALVSEEGQYTPLLVKLLRQMLDKDSFGGLQTQQSAVGGFLGRLGLHQAHRPTDYPVIVVFVCGGLAPDELKACQEELRRHQVFHKQQQVYIGGTELLTAGALVDYLL